MKKQKSFEQSFGWVGVMLLCMGLFFLAAGLLVMALPIAPGDFSSTDGLSVQGFKLVFLGAFGIPGLVLLGIGLGVLVAKRIRRKKAERLKAEGLRVTANVIGLENLMVRVNHRYLCVLRCAFMDMGGQTYVFKSRKLRTDPTYALPNGQVYVYYDRDNMGSYYVDVDGSAATGGFVEL